jgi:CHAT domain-containing protein
LGGLYEDQGNHAKAEPMLIEASGIFKQALGENHPDYAQSLQNLAILYAKQENFAKAEPLYAIASKVYKQALGANSTDYAACLSTMGFLRVRQGRYAQAEPILAEALAIHKEFLGKDHPTYARTLMELAVCEGGLRKSDAAVGHARQGVQIMRRHLELTAAIQSEHQQLLMVDELRFPLDVFLAAGRAAKSAPDATYDEVLAWKGAVTGRQAFLRALRHDLETTTRELAALTNVIPKEPQRKAHLQRLTELSDRIEVLQQKLAAASAPFAARRSQQRRTSAELRQALPPDAALVDLIEYEYFGSTDNSREKPVWQSRVMAFVVRRDQSIARVDLGLSDDLDSAVDAWRKTYGAGKESQQAAATLRAKVWQPLEALLTGANTVLISPDGELAKFPWGALPGKNPGSYLIEERAIAVVPVPQSLPELLAIEKTPTQAAPSLLLVGDVDYGGDPGILLASTRGERAVRSGLAQWPALPATRTEIAAIHDSFQRRFAAGNVMQLDGKQATSEAVRDAAPNHRFLHFATHGFFADPKVQSALAPSDKPELTMDREATRRQISGEHPGLLSGIVLTGANQPPAEGKDDGILTAMEVGELDLRGVELVTLSACETGLGKTAGGEGVLGLQRAFQAAGARTTVTSLWTIPDKATQSLMNRFYTNFWNPPAGRPISKLEALREAQLWLLNNGVRQPELIRGLEFEPIGSDDASSRRLSPRYWAAFVLSGDWR